MDGLPVLGYTIDYYQNLRPVITNTPAGVSSHGKISRLNLRDNDNFNSICAPLLPDVLALKYQDVRTSILTNLQSAAFRACAQDNNDH